MSECSRCRAVAPTVFVFTPHGHTWASLGAEPPSTDLVCGNCITDRELMVDRTIGDVVLFATSVLMRGARPEMLAPLEFVRAHFMVLNLDDQKAETRHRNAALRAVGLSKSEVDSTTKSKSSDLESAVVSAAKTWRLNQINGTPSANAVGALARAIDRVLLETDLIDDETKVLFRRHQND